jgi:hypothetical protein
MLMRLHQLEALAADLTPDQHERLQTALAAARNELEHWRVQAEGKALLEIKSRLRQWSAYVRELESDPRRFVDEYVTHTTGRTTLYFAVQVAGKALYGKSTTSQITMADQMMRNLVAPGDFILDKRLEDAYPRSTFWWLHAWPRGE